MNSDNLKDSDQMLNNTGFMIQRSRLVTMGIRLATEIKRTLKQYLLLYEVNGRAVP
jgi:WASH complex subunit 7